MTLDWLRIERCVAIRAASSNRKEAGDNQAALLGDQKRGRAGFGRTVVVLAGRIGCRSRQAALGPSRLRAKSSWTTTSGLASSRESVEVANERRKPNRRWQSREIGGGSPKTQDQRESDPAGDTLSMEGALDQESRSR